MKTTLHKIYIPNNSRISLFEGADIELADDFTIETGTGTSGRIDMVTEDGEEVTAVEDQPELPSWDEAPEWAQWRAVVGSRGTVFWFETEPVFYGDGSGIVKFTDLAGRWESSGYKGYRSLIGPESIEQRPAELPSWDEAPEWAQWRAVNRNGVALWAERRPPMDYAGWFSIPCTDRYEHIRGNFSHIPWQDSIERRSFEPPWDKIASPFDYYSLSAFGSRPKFYVAAYDNCVEESTPDVWTRTGDYARIERGRVYRRPSK